MIGTKLPDKFDDLETKGNMILKEYLNHRLVNFNKFGEVQGSKQLIKLRSLAYQMMDALHVEREEEAARLEQHWKYSLPSCGCPTSNRGTTPSVVLAVDIWGNPTLHQIITTVKDKRCKWRC
jgi:hypothetical protein